MNNLWVVRACKCRVSYSRKRSPLVFFLCTCCRINSGRPDPRALHPCGSAAPSVRPTQRWHHEVDGPAGFAWWGTRDLSSRYVWSPPGFVSYKNLSWCIPRPFVYCHGYYCIDFQVSTLDLCAAQVAGRGGFLLTLESHKAQHDCCLVFVDDQNWH